MRKDGGHGSGFDDDKTLETTRVVGNDIGRTITLKSGGIKLAEEMGTMDMNGRRCMLCSMPLKDRTDREYLQRTDCGNQSVFEHHANMNVPLSMFVDANNPHHINGYCELNIQKVCADALYNKDFLFQAKSVVIPPGNNFDPVYCNENGWLTPEFVKLQHDFELLDRKQSELCKVKYAPYKVDTITFADFMDQYMLGLIRGYPTREEAEFTGAGVCAMGNAGCDMAYCAYSFCNLGDGKIGKYDECPGWDPIKGMPIPTAAQ